MVPLSMTLIGCDFKVAMFSTWNISEMVTFSMTFTDP